MYYNYFSHFSLYLLPITTIMSHVTLYLTNNMQTMYNFYILQSKTAFEIFMLKICL